MRFTTSKQHIFDFRTFIKWLLINYLYFVYLDEKVSANSQHLMAYYVIIRKSLCFPVTWRAIVDL